MIVSRAVVRTAGRARRDRRDLLRRHRRLPRRRRRRRHRQLPRCGRALAFTLLAAATVAIAWRTDAALFALPGAGLLTVIVLLHWAAPAMFEELVLPSGVAGGAIPEPPTGSGPHLALGLGLAALFGLTGFAAQGRSDHAKIALIWSATAAVAPVAILVALYCAHRRLRPLDPVRRPRAALAALYGYATELLGRREPRPGLAASAAVFATGAVAALALALTFALEKGWLTVALALMVPGIAWIAGQRPLPALRWLAAGVIALVLLRIGYEPRIVGGDIGTTPIFNWLLYGYGVPAACFWYAGHLLRRRADDVPARMADARGDLVHRAARLPRDPPLHDQRRHLRAVGGS